ncbi:reverse transcriptase domain-containing protein [Citrus sinensis]|nr:reverse transcriptase domain-containing protein [Citrus sinensis]
MAGSSAHAEFDLHNACARLQLEEEEEGGLIVTGDEEEDNGVFRIDSRYCLVGRFLTDKALFLESDENNFKGVWRNYMRLRVSIDVRKPLERRMRMKRAGGEWIWVDFKFERLNIFCFICGLLGHIERNCPSLYEDVDGQVTKPYGPWMKAPTRKGMMNSGERWLRNEPPEMEASKFGNSSKFGSVMIMDVIMATKSVHDDKESRGKNAADGNVPMHKESPIFPIINSQMGFNGQDFGDSANIIALLKENKAEYDSALIVLDTKRRRSQFGQQSSVGRDDSSNSNMMDITTSLKKWISGGTYEPGPPRTMSCLSWNCRGNSMMPEMTAAYDSLSIGEDEEDGLVFQSDDMATGQEGLNDVRFCLVGRFLTDKVLTNIGNYIGEFQSSDPNNLMGVWRNFMRIRVSIDVKKPLKKRLRLKKEGGGSGFGLTLNMKEMKAPTRRNAMTSGERWLRSVPPNKGGFTFGMPTKFVSRAEINDTNAKKSGVTTNRKMPNNFGRDGHEHMENMEISKALAVVKIRENQRNDKGKGVDWFTNELDIVHVADSCREKGIVLKETKRRRAEMVVYGLGQSEGDVQSMVVDPKNGLAVGPDAEIEVQEIGKWRLTGFYGYPESSRRRESWDLLRLLSSSSSLPWLCIGDFNDLLAANDKRGKIVHPNWKLVGFQKAIEDCNLIDLGVEGYQYTWERARGTDRWVEERLDRAFASEAWLQRFTRAKRAKSLWLREGDQNTRYFHASASARKRQNSLGNLRNDQGEWCANSDEVDALIVDYFKGLFTAGEVQTAEVLQCVATKVTSEHNSMLLAPFSAIEVKDAVFGMHPDKSPGPDGMNPAFYQKFWHIVGEDVVLACLKFLQDASFPVGLNDTSIVLIPKKQRPEFLSDMRPIALCNVLYKIISKMLANRMKLVLDLVISDSQSAFVPGRAITNNIIISAEIMHFLKRKWQGKNGVAALKIDMSKAYDRIKWKFLQDMMLKMGFDAKWVALMMLCVSTVRYRVLREGKELGPIVPCRGLRQGDPLSPYLFILCADGLSSLIRRQERNGLIHGVRIARGAPSVSHLFLADDSFLFFRANDNEANLIKHLLAVYGRASGQVVNFSKSSISFSANVVESVSREICAILEVNSTANHGAYLGLPSAIGRKKKEVFKYIRDKLWQRLQGWSTRMLSRAGKEILLKTVALALPNYAMSIYLLPKELCRELEGLMNSFWWRNNHSSGKGINWVKWEYLCNPKGCGGLGFKQLHLFNIAMLGRQMWKLLTCPESLMARILKARYYPRTSVVRASLGHNPSYVWRSILAAKEVVVQGSRVQVGSGHSISIGKDPWLPDLQDGCVSTNLNEELAAAPVSSLMMPHQRVWDYDVVSDIFNLRDKELILKIPLSSRREEDMCFAQSCWNSSSVGFVGYCSTFLDWLAQVFIRCSKEECNIAMMICWQIWVNRNNKVWNNTACSVCQILNSAGQFLYQWQAAKRQVFDINDDTQRLVHGALCWEKPKFGWVKCNVDAAVFASQGKIGIGCVIRNSQGGFLAARCVEVVGNFGAREAEALSIREALSWMKELHFPCVIIEMDCLQVFRALVEEFSSPNGFGLIIEDCRALVKFIGEVQFSFVCRSANCAAHSVARASGSLSGLQEWNIVPPVWLLNNL